MDHDEDRSGVLAQLALDQLHDEPWFEEDELDDDPETIDGLGGCRFRSPRHHRPPPIRVMLH